MAPSSRAVQKAEAKYGVTADYPDLQLHSAAANGNVGLVKYALMHGQPVNSVLNGVLPIHIAASSGNEHVVQMLIDAGADVNAARLPRKYNTDRAKASSSIGAAGSTPLHFAAANGHLSVVTLLLSHNANLSTAEKHGLTPEDLARDAGHVDVVTALQLWKRTADQHRYDSDNVSIARSTRSARDVPSRRYLPSATSIKDLRAAAAANAASSSPGSSVYSGGTGKKYSTPFESISNRSKKLAKAASNPNLAALLHGQTGSNQSHPHISAPSPQFPAPAPLTLRQNPMHMQAMQRQTTQPLPSNNHLMHQVINTDKARRPSLPSVLEKAAHPGASIKSALGMTPRTTHFGKNRSASASSHSDRNANDPYHFGGPRRSGSKTSLTNVFRTNNSRERSGDNSSQPISPAASTFFTADDELEEAERDAFLHMDRDPSSGDETYLQHYPQTHRPGSSGYPDGRQQPSHAYRNAEWSNGRSRAGSGSSAATTTSGSVGRGYPSAVASAQNYPVTAPATQTAFFPNERSASSVSIHNLGLPRPSFSSYTSSSSNLVIPQPIPPPPSSSMQPFFSKAAIAAAHNNIPTQRPGFYRPRKSSQLSTSTSTMSGSKLQSLHSPDLQGQTPRQFSPLLSNDSTYDEDGFRSSSDYTGREVTHVTGGPSVVIRRPTVREPMNSAHLEQQRNGASTTPNTSLPEEEAMSSAPSTRPGTGSSSTYAGSRHTRASSDGTGSLRPLLPIGNLSDVVETSSEKRQRSQSQDPVMPLPEENDSSEVDPETAREIEDTFPVDQERPFPTRSRAGSRARVDSVGSSSSSVPYGTASPSLQPSTAFAPSQYYHGGHETDSSWSGITRPSRSGSTTTDTRTSRSGSTGEGSGHAPRFFGFEYSSSPSEPYQTYNTEMFTSTSRTASNSSFNYQPSDSTNATSLISSPPGTAMSGRFTSPAPASEGKGTTVTHAQAQSIVKRKEEELLSYNPSVASSESDRGKHLSLSQQLAAYGESLSIERELSHAEAHKGRHSAEPVTLTIPEPPASAKYSWEILGKETRTTVPLTSGKRTKEVETASRQAPQPLWTHKMVSPFEASLPRPAGQASGHRHTTSNSTMATITSSGKPLQRVPSREPAATKSATTSPTQPQDNSNSVPTSQTLSPTMTRDVSLRNKMSNLSVSTSYLAPPRGGSDVSATRRSPRSVSANANLLDKSPRSSLEKERLPSTTYHLATRPGSEPTDSANSSLVSEPRSMRSINTIASSYATATPYSSRHRNHRSDQTTKSQSPEATIAGEETPRPPPQMLRLETTMAPKFHIEPKAGGEFAPTPTKSRFANKIGKLFK